MTQAPAELSALASLRARTALARNVRILLKGTGLEIRELANELVISNPGHPEKGRVFVTYARAEVSLRRVEWDYLGYLDGCGSEDHDPESFVDAGRIISALGGRVGNSS